MPRMIDWTAVKIDGRVREHSITQKVQFKFINHYLTGTIVEAHNKSRVWVQLDDGAQHLVDRSELIYVKGD